MIMKKNYISPVGRIINVEAEALIAGAPSLTVDNTARDNVSGDSDRRSFEAWDNMQE